MSGNKADSSYVHLFLLGRIRTSLYISSENGSEMYVVVKCMHAQHVDTDWKYYFKNKRDVSFVNMPLLILLAHSDSSPVALLGRNSGFR